MNVYLVVLVVYSCCLIGAGLVLARWTRDSSDFYVAGRRLGPGLLFATVLAANIGSGSTVGAAGLGYAMGLSGWWWVGSAGIGSLVLAFLVGPRIRRLAAGQNFLTMGDFLEARFGLGVRLVVISLLWAGTLSLLAGQLIAFSWILQVVAGTGRPAGSLLGGVVVVLYFASGGLKGTAWINVSQLVIKAIGFLVCLPFVYASIGGWEQIVARSPSPEYLSFVGEGWTTVLPYLVLLAPSFIVSPGLIQKVYGARNDRTVKVGVGLNGAALLFFSFIPVFLGIAAATRFPHLEATELALPTVITELVPVWVGAILLASVFSAEVSSADAILFMLSTSLTRDFYKRILNPGLDDRSLLRASRITAVAAGGLAVILGLLLESVVDALRIFYGLLSVALFAPVIVGLYRNRPGATGGLWAVVVSVLAAGLFHLLTGGQGIGAVSSTAVGITVSFVVLALTGLWRK